MCKYPWENGIAERINGVIKNNYLKHRRIENYQDLIREVDHAVQMYNYDKPHIRLNRNTPVKFENKMILLHQQTS
jgi:transposase InsO family protein